MNDLLLPSIVASVIAHYRGLSIVSSHEFIKLLLYGKTLTAVVTLCLVFIGDFLVDFLAGGALELLLLY